MQIRAHNPLLENMVAHNGFSDKSKDLTTQLPTWKNWDVTAKVEPKYIFFKYSLLVHTPFEV